LAFRWTSSYATTDTALELMLDTKSLAILASWAGTLEGSLGFFGVQFAQSRG